MISVLQGMLEWCFNNLHPELKDELATLLRWPTPAELAAIEKRKERIRENGKHRVFTPTPEIRERSRRAQALYRARRAADRAFLEKRNAQQRAWNKTEVGMRAEARRQEVEYQAAHRANQKSRRLAAKITVLQLKDLENPTYIVVNEYGLRQRELWPLHDEADQWLEKFAADFNSQHQLQTS